jgi:hypothetical protein
MREFLEIAALMVLAVTVTNLLIAGVVHVAVTMDAGSHRFWHTPVEESLVDEVTGPAPGAAEISVDDSSPPSSIGTTPSGRRW